MEICFILNVAIVNSFTFYDKVNRNACVSHDNAQIQYKLNKVSEGNFHHFKQWREKSEVGHEVHSIQNTSQPWKIIRPVKSCAMCMRRKWKPHGAVGFVAYTCKQYSLSLCHVNSFLTLSSNKIGKNVLHNVDHIIPSNILFSLLSLFVIGL